jgi:divalent metal cation (Fe/Co/Zn/Cd) transporter
MSKRNKGMATHSITIDREAALRRGRRLEYFTVAWNSLEALASIVAGAMAGSIALVAFGLDSVIETVSGGALIWRLHHSNDVAHRRENSERLALRVVGVCFLLLSLYVLVDSAHALITREAPERSLFGIIITVVSVIAMPLLARAKRQVAAAISSEALKADSRQTDLCAYLSAIVLLGLSLNALLGWWWADPVAGLLMVPIIAREGYEALRGKDCGCHGTECQ